MDKTAPDLISALGRAIYEIARPTMQVMEERPAVGSLVVETTRSLSRGGRPGDPAGLGTVVEIRGGDRLEQLTVVIRRIDDETLQPWVNAAFAVASENVRMALQT